MVDGVVDPALASAMEAAFGRAIAELRDVGGAETGRPLRSGRW